MRIKACARDAGRSCEGIEISDQLILAHDRLRVIPVVDRTKSKASTETLGFAEFRFNSILRDLRGSMYRESRFWAAFMTEIYPRTGFLGRAWL